MANKKSGVLKRQGGQVSECPLNGFKSCVGEKCMFSVKFAPSSTNPSCGLRSVIMNFELLRHRDAVRGTGSTSMKGGPVHDPAEVLCLIESNVSAIEALEEISERPDLDKDLRKKIKSSRLAFLRMLEYVSKI